jgi:DNA polymerase-3 subunit delta'
MSMAGIPGQTRGKALLQKMVERSLVPHALLFTGEMGIGKSRIARSFAKLLNCMELRKGDSCDACSSCRRIESGQHPDLLWVKKDGTFIKIDQIRQIKDRLKYRPFEAPWRVVVVEDAHDLKEEAANAFLKILEEPPRNNLFILLSLEPRMVLPTIVSRCCHIRFQPLDEALIEQLLTLEDGVAPDVARKAAGKAAGSLERARKLADSDAIAHDEAIRQNIRQLARGSLLDLFSLTAKWAKESPSLDDDLDCIKLWLREMIHGRLAAQRPLSSRDFARPQAAKPAECNDALIERLFRLYDGVEQAHQHLRVNANKQLVLEGVCLAIRNTFNG